MKTSLLLLLMHLLFFANAQNERRSIYMHEKFAIIAMSKLPIADFPKNSIKVSGIKVIQSVRDSFRMGYTVKGMDQAVATLIFDQSLSEILQVQANRMYKHEFKKSGVEMLWSVKDLRFGERPGLTDYSYTRFNADAYISSGEGLFKRMCTIDTVIVVPNGSGHGSDIENVFRILLKKTMFAANELADQNTEGKKISQIMDESKPRVDMPIFKDNIYQEGIYASFDEFLQNKPSITDYEPVINNKTIKFVSAGKTDAKNKLPVWGLCKDGEIYKYYEETLIPIKREGTGFIISNYVSNTTKRNYNASNLGLLGAFIGGLAGTSFTLASMLLTQNHMLVKSINYINDPEKQPVATCIDMRTGELSF